MWLLLATAIIVVSVFIAYRFDESICDALPVTGAMTVLTLYLLAMFREMKFIYIISAVITALSVWRIIRMKRAENKDECGNGRALPEVLQPSFICFWIMTIGITLLTKDQIFTWWDDINFWSSDAKQIFFLNGFPGKYGNVSPEFGDYPPVTSLFKWIFLQISPGEYKEGLQFAGYYTLNAIFLMPLAGSFDDKKFTLKNSVIQIASTVLVYLIPGIVNGIIFYGTPADITMGIVYGALLYAVWDREGHRELFYYGRIALYTAVLLLTKSVGIEWALFAAVFFFVLNFADGEKGRVKKALLTFGTAFVFYFSWLLFCLMNRRVAKSTGLGIKMATGSYVVPGNALLKAKYFLLGMWTMPMHADHNITFDPSIGVILVIIFAALFAMCRKGIFDGKEKKKITVFMILTGLVTYGLIFFAHISLFQSEDQYLDAFAMTNSIARYGAPFVLGSMYLIMGAALRKRTSVMIPLIIASFILLTTDYQGTLYALYGYRDKLSTNRTYNSDMIDEGGAEFLMATGTEQQLWGHRVLNLRSDSFNHWVHDTYISKEASPVPVVYGTLEKADNVDSLRDKIITSHAEYLYVEKVSGDDDAERERLARACFDKFMDEGMEFEYNRIYYILRTQDSFVLLHLKGTD